VSVTNFFVSELLEGIVEGAEDSVRLSIWRKITTRVEKSNRINQGEKG